MHFLIDFEKKLKVSPALEWAEMPAGTQDIVIQLIDDVTGKTHWLLYNIFHTVGGLVSNASEVRKKLITCKPGLSLRTERVEGINDFQTTGYFPLNSTSLPKVHVYALYKPVSNTIKNRYEILQEIKYTTIESQIFL